MRSKIQVILYVFLSLALNIENSHGYVCKGIKVITHGEPCYLKREFPFRIEGPKEPVEEPKIPIPLNLRIIPEITIPRRIEYPIQIDIPKVPETSLQIVEKKDELRGRTYNYNIKVPEVITMLPSSKNYNFGVEVPPAPRTTTETVAEKNIQYLTGLRSKIDRILVPACEVPPKLCQ